jgi:hypothetical protein
MSWCITTALAAYFVVPGLEVSAFWPGALRELWVALVQGNEVVYREAIAMSASSYYRRHSCHTWCGCANI